MPNVCSSSQSSCSLELVEVLGNRHDRVEVIWFDEIDLSENIALMVDVCRDVTSFCPLVENYFPFTEVTILVKVQQADRFFDSKDCDDLFFDKEDSHRVISFTDDRLTEFKHFVVQ